MMPFDARRADERRIADVAGLLAEDGAQQLLFRRQLRLALRRHLADEDVARLDVGADADDAAVVEVTQVRLRHVRNVARDLFRPELGVARFDLELLDVDGGVVVLLHHLLGDEDRVLEVVAAPRHERDEHVPAERELAQLRARSVGQHLPLRHPLPDADDRLLVDAGVLVRALELRHRVDVGAHFLAQVLGALTLPFHAHDDALAVDVVHGARPPRDDHRARVARGDVLHAGADIRAAGAQQRHGLALHVRSHQRAVRVVVLEERDERGGDGDELLRRHVDELHLVPRREDEVAGATRVDAVLHEAAAVVERRVGLRDDVLILFPGGEVVRVRLELDALLLRTAVGADQLVGLDDVADLVLRVATGVGDDHVVDDAAVLHLAVGRLDEAELVDPRVAGERRDQADVRTFRRLNRADASVVRRMDVAHFEPGALARQAAGPERRETPLVRDLGERIGLVHELRQLRRPEELANRGHDRLRVDQVVRHGGRHFLVDRHLFLDRALHADQADAELVLEQLADRAHAPVAEMIDVVHVLRVLPQLQLVLDDLVEVLRVQDLLVERRLQPELRVQLQTADPREVVLLRVEEHVLEERPRAVERRRIAGTQPAVDLDQRLLVRADRILLQRLADDGTDLVALREEDLDLLDALLLRHRDDARRQLLVRLEDDFAGLGIDDVGGGKRAFERFVGDGNRLDAGLAQRGDRVGADLLAALHREVARLHVGSRAQPDQAVVDRPHQRLALVQEDAIDRVERADDLVGAAQAERAQEHRGEELPLAVDADVEQVLLVVLELHPRAAIRDDLRDVERLVFRVEERARRAVQLRDDDALGAVDDERAVVGHQRDVAEVDLLLLDVADGLDAGLGVLVPDDETDGDLERHGVGHAALLALVDVVLELHPDRVAADVADVAARLVRHAAARAEHLVVAVRIGNERRAAVLARLAQVVQARQLAALALPVADRILDELERRVLAEVADREDGLEDGLQAGILPFRREAVHLQEPLVRLPLNLDEVRDRNRRLDFREVLAFAVDVLRKAVHR